MFFFKTHPPQAPVPTPEPFSAVLRKVVISAFLTLVAAVLTLGIGAIILSEVWQFVSNLDEFKVDTGSLKMDLPKWAAPAIADDLRQTAKLSGARSIFEPGLGKRIREAYSASPWVVRITHVNRIFPNSMEIGFVLREPAASVQVGDASYLVDAKGVLLSRKFYTWPADAQPLPTIVPTGSVTVCGPGNLWEEESVQAGVGLLRLFREYGLVEGLRIVTVDVSNYRGMNDKKTSEIVVWNNNRTHIKWGRFASNRRPGEVADMEKLQNLLTVVRREGPALANVDYVDVRWANPYVMRKGEVASAQAPPSR